MEYWTNLYLRNTQNSYQINHFNIGNLESQSGTQKVTLHPNKAQTFSSLYAITNKKSVKLVQIERLLPSSKTSPAETRSNKSCRYTILKSYIPWLILLYKPMQKLIAINHSMHGNNFDFHCTICQDKKY